MSQPCAGLIRKITDQLLTADQIERFFGAACTFDELPRLSPDAPFPEPAQLGPPLRWRMDDLMKWVARVPPLASVEIEQLKPLP